MSLAPALQALGSLKQFIVCSVEPHPAKPGKTNKVPQSLRFGFPVPGSAQDPANWMSADAAFEWVSTHAHHRPDSHFAVGFSITQADPVWCLDIDGCRTPTGWSTTAQELAAQFPGAAVEISSSGNGLHVWGCGRAPAHGSRNQARGAEFYTEDRFIALGDQASATGNVAVDWTPQLAAFVPHYFPPAATGLGTGRDEEWNEGPCAEWAGPTDDTVLLQRAMRSSGGAATIFSGGNKASFADLFECNVPVLSLAYPDAIGKNAFDGSAADMALASQLAYWTGRDHARIERLMRQSKLVRAKWDDRGDYYLPRTIRMACATKEQVLTEKSPAERPGPASAIGAPRPTPIAGETLLFGDQQAQLFEGCVLVMDELKVLVPGGWLYRPEQFRAHFGRFSFMMDPNGERKPSRSAWEAFTESQIFSAPRADTTCFRPDLAPGATVEDGGRTMVNTYWPVETPRAAGDASPFLNHLAKLLPDQRDRDILLSYMAACVQHKGVKFQWAPLIQGVEGNGKTLLSRCVARAIGERYVHWPTADKIAGNFNAWMYGKIFFAVEDIHVGENKADVIERLKPMITGGTGLEIEAKGVDQVSRNVVGNFIFNTNHKSGLRKTRNDRRFCVFYTAQQEYADLARDGMDESYMSALYTWLETGGYAIVNELLLTYPITDSLNPAKGCQRAPRTSTTEEALAMGVGRVEQEILEAIEQGMQGFAGGWISSSYLDTLLDKLGKAGAIPLNRRREMLQSLGYDWHPALAGSLGRVDNRVQPDNAKPKLFIRMGHPDAEIINRADVARAYTAAQTAATMERTS